MSNSIGENIKSIRELKNYTQKYMSVRMGITQAGYSKIENGATDLNYNKLILITSILGVNLEDVIFFDKGLNSFKGNKEKQNIIYNSDKDFYSEKTNLYQDKIILLEKLLKLTEVELKRYKEKYGEF